MFLELDISTVSSFNCEAAVLNCMKTLDVNHHTPTQHFR